MAVDGITATYISPNKFSVTGNQTADFHTGRRVKAELTGGDVYSTISGSVFGAVTTVTIYDSELDNTLTKVWYGIGWGGSGSLPDHTHDSSEGSGAQFTSLVFLAPATIGVPDNTDLITLASGVVTFDAPITIGNSDLGNVPGSVRWTGADLEWNDGAAWQSLTGGGASSPWTTDANGIYYDSGNVGIGTDSEAPIQLAVSGTNTQVRFGRTANSGGYLISTGESQAILVGGGYWDGSNWRARFTAAQSFYGGGGYLRFYSDTGLTVGNTYTPTQRMLLDQSGALFINDDANTDMTIGLTINQGANDDEAFAIKSSDVAHGGTDIAETDTWLYIKKDEGDAGGAYLMGMKDTDAAYGGGAFRIFGYQVDNADTTLGTSGRAIIETYSNQFSGTGHGNVVADGNIIAFRSRYSSASASRWILNTHGVTWQQGSLFINESSCADITIGLCINQGANDDQILAFKSSDVAHGLTTYGETDTFVNFKKANSTGGGLQINTIAEDGDTGFPVFQLRTFGAQAKTEKTTSGRSLIEFAAYEHDGANSLANITADGNILGVRCRRGGATETVFIINEDGATWQDGGATIGGDFLYGANTISGTGDIYCGYVEIVDVTSEIQFTNTSGTIGVKDEPALLVLDQSGITVDGHIRSTVSGVYDIGESGLPFRDIYLTGGSVYLNAEKISSPSPGVIDFGGAEIQNATLSGSGGTTDHSALSNLDFSSSGHTDFVSLNTTQTISGSKTFAQNIFVHSEIQFTSTSGIIGVEAEPALMFLNQSGVTFDGHIRTTVSGVYSIGEQNLPFKDIYLTGGSIYLEGSSISLDQYGNFDFGDKQLITSGPIQLGNTSNFNPGLMRWTGSDFEGYTGAQWESLTSGGTGDGTGGGGGALVFAQTETVTSGTTAINISVPDTADWLEVHVHLRSMRTGGTDALVLRFNGATSAEYNSVQYGIHADAVPTIAGSGVDGYNKTFIRIGDVAALTGPYPDHFYPIEFKVYNYKDTERNTTVVGENFFLSGITDAQIWRTSFGGEWATASGVNIINILSYYGSAFDDGEVVVYGYSNTVSGTVGASEFLELIDTPATYSGSAGQYVRAKATEDGLEFATVSGVGGDFLARDGSTPLAGDWDFGSQTISGTGDIWCNDLHTAAGSLYVGDFKFQRYGTTTAISGSGGMVLSGGLSTGGESLAINQNNSGNRNAYIDFTTDDTYTDYGMRLIRYNTGTNANQELIWRGTGTFQIASTEGGGTLHLDGSGGVFINDTTNANMTIGLTINQAANDDEILAFKSSDVTHGITDYWETDTYAMFKKYSSTAGGLYIQAMSEDVVGVTLEGEYTNDDTTKGSSALAPVILNAYKKSGTGVGAQGANANTVVIKSNWSTIWHVDEDGDTWQSGNATVSQDGTSALFLAERTGSFSGSDEVGIFQCRYDGDSLAQMAGYRDGANDAASLIFSTQPTGGSLTSRLKIDSTGLINYYDNTISGTGDVYCNDIYTASGTVYIGDEQISAPSPGVLDFGGATITNAPSYQEGRQELFIEYSTTSGINILPGRIDIEDSGTEYALQVSGTLFKDSNSLSASTWYYVYAKPPGSGNLLSESEIELSTTEPARNAAKMGYYHGANTTWRCFGAFYVNSSVEIQPFMQQGERWVATDNVISQDVAAFSSDSWTDATWNIPFGDTFVIVDCRGLYSDTYRHLYYRKNGDSGTGFLIVTVNTNYTHPNGHRDLPVDSDKKGEVKWSTSGSDNAYLNTQGFILPNWIAPK
jgi:hypothetical protein